MKKKKLKELITPWGSHEKIAAEFGCHPNTVRNSLSGKFTSKKNLAIRELAKSKYGAR